MSDLAYKKALTEYLEGFVSERRRGRLHEVLAERTNHMQLVLEDVYQTHNFSAVLRSADIFGIQTTNFIENRKITSCTFVKSNISEILPFIPTPALTKPMFA